MDLELARAALASGSVAAALSLANKAFVQASRANAPDALRLAFDVLWRAAKASAQFVRLHAAAAFVDQTLRDLSSAPPSLASLRFVSRPQLRTSALSRPASRPPSKTSTATPTPSTSNSRRFASPTKRNRLTPPSSGPCAASWPSDC